MNDKPLVRFDVADGIGVVTIDNPPVNALGPGVRDGIVEALDPDNQLAAATPVCGPGHPKPHRRQ